MAGDLSCVVEFDPASLFLAGFGRFNTGTVRGDHDLANRFFAGFAKI